MDEIRSAFDRMAVGYACQLWCEPGRALVAEAELVIVKVDGRRGNTLYVNDGAFGTLYDAAHCKWVFPAQAYSAHGNPLDSHSLAPFGLYGPTCDSADHLPGPFMLPPGIGEGDYIEIGNIGAYGRVMAEISTATAITTRPSSRMSQCSRCIRMLPGKTARFPPSANPPRYPSGKRNALIRGLPKIRSTAT